MSNVALFLPCLVDQTAPLTGVATHKLLLEKGWDVVWVKEQTCCGQALFNAGFRREAVGLAERFIRIFAPYPYVVAPSGSCVSMVKHHYQELNLTGELEREWQSLRGKIFELCQFLVMNEVGRKDHHSPSQPTEVRFPHKVFYHPSCHYLRELGEKAAPLKLLAQIPDLKLVGDTVEPECCGFGGAFSVKYPELSQAIAQRRWSSIADAEAEVVTGVDDSCLNHLRVHQPPELKTIKIVHISLILAGMVDSS